MSRSTQRRFNAEPHFGLHPWVFADQLAQSDVEGRKFYFGWDLARNEETPRARAWSDLRARLEQGKTLLPPIFGPMQRFRYDD